MTVLLGVFLVVLGWIAGVKGSLLLRVFAAALSIPLSLAAFFFAHEGNAVLIVLAYLFGFNVSLVVGAVTRDVLSRRIPEHHSGSEAADVDP